MDSSRLIDLEIKISHQELGLEKLQERVFAQDAALQSLEQTVKILRSRVEALAQGEGGVGPANEKPPHY